MRGRRPQGLKECLGELEGSSVDKQRLQVILGTLSGEVRVLAACERLDIGETRFRQLRGAILQGALAAIAPGVPGRPSLKSLADGKRIRKLEEALEETELKLGDSELREEIAVILGHGARRDSEARGKKTRRRHVKLRRLQRAATAR